MEGDCLGAGIRIVEQAVSILVNAVQKLDRVIAVAIGYGE